MHFRLAPSSNFPATAIGRTCSALPSWEPTAAASHGAPVFVPAAAHAEAMSLVHAGHRGVTAMKNCARSYLCWARIDQEIEETARSCPVCQSALRAPVKVPLPRWTWAPECWHTLHVGFAGPIDGCNLVIVDAHTKWLGVRQVSHPTSAAVAKVLRSLFATFGIARRVMSNNGTAFVSDEIRTFYERNGVEAITSAPYHPATNGQAERYIAELKKALVQDTTRPIQRRLNRFLFRQHTTVHAGTGVTPANGMFGRELS